MYVKIRRSMEEKITEEPVKHETVIEPVAQERAVENSAIKDCIFCSQEVMNAKILENELAYAIYDKYPKSLGHMLIIPKSHSADFFAMSGVEKIAMISLLNDAKEFLDKQCQPDGYNILANCGDSAGQEIFHAHIHLIPRYKNEKAMVYIIDTGVLNPTA